MEFERAKVRDEIVEALRKELLGPKEQDEELTEPPEQAYILGMLVPEGQQEKTQLDDNSDSHPSDEREEFIDNESLEDPETMADDEDNDQFKLSGDIKLKPSSLGFNFFIKNETSSLIAKASWGEYTSEKVFKEDSEGKTKGKGSTIYKRAHKEFQLNLNLSASGKVEVSEGIFIEYVKRKLLDTDYSIISIFLINRKKSLNSNENNIYQVKLDVEGEFYSEFLAKNKQSIEDFLYREKPVFSRGYSCAVMWENTGETASKIYSEFLPEYEIPSVRANIDGLDLFMKNLGDDKPTDFVPKLNKLRDMYEEWIKNLDKNLNPKLYPHVLENCTKSLNRIDRGIKLLESNINAAIAFKFMNKVLYQQYCMRVYSKKRKNNPELVLEDVIKEEKGLDWRPFQLAFILQNLEGLVNPKSSEREIVDLLWFPTGGGKTEAYLGLIAFTLVYRRLTKDETSLYENDGGVSVILRYTLRLLTTQQRDRLLKMICAAERLRKLEEISAAKKIRKANFGYTPFSVGFWVGNSTTPNAFKEFEEPYSKAMKNVRKQILSCPCCGELLEEKNYTLQKKSLEVKCTNDKCFYSKEKIPVYLVDEEIYNVQPSVIMSTVDKFAMLPWKSEMASLFGKREKSKNFLPPEMIIQDELHLITGPLGTIYGAYETAIEDLCSYSLDGKKIKPKYVVSTATIKNADNQIQKLYARNEISQFPPQGLTQKDSFFAKEVSLEDKPFRKYLGIAAFGQSMKTAIVRLYALLLQTTEKYENPQVIDPYKTLIGYYNSIRELGGAVMLLKDDIPARINRLKRLTESEKGRFLKTSELTSRIPSYKIPEVLAQLENPWGSDSKNFLDVAVATNMISVGMDVDRLGLMVVTGQPKTTAEYIQASSRIGRQHPGLVICLYNPYRPRDLSHFESFIPYHSSLYRYVESTTATPYSARARDKTLHASIVALMRLGDEVLYEGSDASNIAQLEEKVDYIRELIRERISIIQPENTDEAMDEFESFIDEWKKLAKEYKKVYFHWPAAASKGHLSLLQPYNRDYGKFSTLQSMRDVAQNVHINYYEEGDE